MTFSVVIGVISGLATIGVAIATLVSFISKNSQTKKQIIIPTVSVIGVLILVILVAAFLSGGVPITLPTTDMSKLTTTPFTQPTAPPTSQQSPTSLAQGTKILTPQEVQSWCVVTGIGICDLSRFEQLPLSGGGTDPNAVHMKTGAPVRINLPQGFSAHIWDCPANKGFDIKGPADIPEVCEMSVRRL